MNPDNKPWRSDGWKSFSRLFLITPITCPITFLLYSLTSKNFKFLWLFLISLFLSAIFTFVIYKEMLEDDLSFSTFISIVILSVNWFWALYLFAISFDGPDPFTTLKNKNEAGFMLPWILASYCLFFLPFGFPFSLLCAGLPVKNKKCWKSFFITFFVMIVAIVLIFLDDFSVYGKIIYFLDWLFLTTHYFGPLQKDLELVSNSPPISNTNPLTAPPPPTNKIEAMGKELITNLRKWKREIESVQLQNDIEELIQICLIVMKRKDGEAWRFFTTYGEKVDTMLAKYDEIENTRINSPEMVKAMALVEKSISEIVVAFRNEVNEMYKKDILDLSADTKAFMHNLRTKGLID